MFVEEEIQAIIPKGTCPKVKCSRFVFVRNSNNLLGELLQYEIQTHDTTKTKTKHEQE